MTTNISAEIVGGSLDGLTGNMSKAAAIELKRQKTGGLFREQEEQKKSPFADIPNLYIAPITEPKDVAYIIDGIEYRMEEIESYIQEGYLELVDGQYQWQPEPEPA